MTKNKKFHGHESFDKKYFKRVLKENHSKELHRLSNMFYGWFNFINQYVPVKKSTNKKVLEIGCHIGAFSKVLSDQGFKVYACDISKYIIDKAQELNLKVKFFPLDINKQSFSSNEKSLNEKFDYIFAFEVLEHVEDPEQALLNIKRMLKKSGKFIFSTPYPSDLAFADTTHINVHETNWWREKCRKAGFKNIRFTYVFFIPFLYRFSKFFSLGIPLKINNSYLKISSTTMFFMEG